MSVLPDVASEALDYNNIKRRAMASRSYRIRLSPSNKTSFNPGETINLDLPSNLSGTFMDMSQTYIRFKVTYTKATDGNVALDKCGAYGFIQRCMAISSGSQLFDINNYNVLVSALMDTDASNDWKANAGNVLCGTTASSPHGEIFSLTNGATVTRTYCLPFILTPFSLQKKLLPLFSLDSVRFRLTLETAATALICSAGTVNYQLNDVELVSYLTELSPSAMAQLDSVTGGVYNLLCPSYSNAQSTMGQASVVNTVLGIAVSSLERIIVIHRPSGVVSGADNVSGSSLGAHITNGITTAQFFINSEAYPQRNVSVDDMAAEPLAEFLIADHALSDFSRASCIQNFNVSTGAGAGRNIFDGTTYTAENAPTGANLIAGTNSAWNNNGAGLNNFVKAVNATQSDVGSFVLAIELETGCSAGRSDRLYSGISTISSVVQYKGTYGSPQAGGAVIDFFAQFTILLTLNMRQTGVWSITI